MSNSTEQIPSGATHKTPKGTYMKNTGGAWFEWLHEWVEVGRRVGVEQLTEIERHDVPTADIDWGRQEVPEGATHYQRACAATRNTARYFKDDFNKAFVLTHPENGWIDFPKEQLTPEAYANMLAIPTTVFDLESSTYTIPRPESINDVARTIEAARMAEKSMLWLDGDARYFETSDVPETKKYPHYFKDVSAVDAIDLYHVARLYEITDPALFHAFKKIACAGKRGAKDQAQDVQEAIDALKRWQELSA